MQFDFGLDLVSHFVVISAVTLALVIMCLVLYSELDATNGTSLFYYREASAKYLKNLVTFIFGFAIGFFLFVYFLCYHLYIRTNKENFEKRNKEPKHLIIKDKIIPVADTLIVIGDKKLGKTDTVQIEEFYKYKELKFKK